MEPDQGTIRCKTCSNWSTYGSLICSNCHFRIDYYNKFIKDKEYSYLIKEWERKKYELSM